MKIEDVEKHKIRIVRSRIFSTIKYVIFKELFKILVLVIIIRAAIKILNEISMFLIISIEDILDSIIVEEGSIKSDSVDKIISSVVFSHHRDLLKTILIRGVAAIINSIGKISINICFLLSLILDLCLRYVRLLLKVLALGLPRMHL